MGRGGSQKTASQTARKRTPSASAKSADVVIAPALVLPPLVVAKKIRRAKRVRLALRDGRKSSVLSWPGRGTPLVLLHGFLDDAAGWRQLARATNRPCYAINLAGFGGSDCPTHNRIGAYAADVVEVLHQLGLKDFVLVGHSFGGAVATRVAEEIPEQVSSLVLLAPAGFGRFTLAELAHLPVIKEIARLTLPFTVSNPLTASVVYRLMVANGKRPDKEMLSRLRKNAFANARGAECANDAMVAAGHSKRAFFKRQVDYSGPTSILYGDHDRLVPKEHLHGMQSALPQAQLTTWGGMGHHPQRERPTDLVKFIEDSCPSAHTSHRARSVVSV